MTRGFGIDASTPFDVAMEVASRSERHGYSSFWVNGSPHDPAMDIIEGALKRTGLDVGVGVFPLPKISAEDLITEVEKRDLDQQRLSLGVGSGRPSGALDEVRQAAGAIRDRLDVRVTTAAVGPRMMALAAQVADAVILTWSFAAEVQRARGILERSANDAGREPPTLISFIRCALLPQAADAVAERAAAYDAIPHYRKVFARNGLTAADTVVTGADREELLEGIQYEEAVIDESVIRAIPAGPTVDALADLVEACAP